MLSSQAQTDQANITRSRTAFVTSTVLKEYKEMIAETKSDLEDRKEALDDRLKNISSLRGNLLEGELNDRIWTQQERDSTMQCLEICAEVLMHIDQVQPNVLINISTPPKTS
jgi:hypothetical protein